MWKRAVAIGVLCLLASVAPASAQRVEISGIFGWTISDGVFGDARLAGDGQLYNEIDLKDSQSFGFGVGIFLTEQAEVGFLYGRQSSTLIIRGATEREIGDIGITNYHPYVGYNFGDSGSKVRPYLLIGLGATNYPSVSFTSAAGQSRETLSETQFSTTWGTGVKMYPSSNVGFRAGVQWTPTYIKSDAGGYWCDPYWGCYLVGDPQYSNQFQFSGGVTVRF